MVEHEVCDNFTWSGNVRRTSSICRGQHETAFLPNWVRSRICALTNEQVDLDLREQGSFNLTTHGLMRYTLFTAEIELVY